MKAKTTLIFNRSEITAGTCGASLGPDAVVTAARQQKSDFFQRNPHIEVDDFNELLDIPTPYRFAKRIDGLIKVYKNVSELVFSEMKAGKIPVLLAADHGSAGGTIAGIAAANPTARIGVVWIDAHSDIHTPYTTPSGNMHGMPLSTALNIDNTACGINDLDTETIELWNQLKNTGKEGAKINPADLVYIAVRDTEPEEEHLMKELDLRNYTVKEVREKGVENVLSEILDKLAPCDIIYVSFDVDSMDPILTSYGTGTPVANGLSPEEAAGFLEGFAANTKTACMEFVEVNPCLDEKKNKMAEVAFELLERTVNTIHNR